jgi:glycosyltransferase involved in cell wall biosynthesis
MKKNASPPAGVDSAKVALLTNFVDPQKVAFLETLGRKFGTFTIFVSTQREGHRHWKIDTGTLHVEHQKTITVKSCWRHPMGFKDVNYLHFPLDTYTRLKAYRPKVVISSQLGLRTLSACLFRLLHWDTRLIVWVQMTEHQQMGWRPVRKWIRKCILRCVDAVIANGHSAKRYMAGLGFPEETIFISLGSIELGRFLAMPPKSQVSRIRRFLYVGRLVDGKGILQFLSRLAVFAESNSSVQLVFEVIGYGPLEEAIKGAQHPPNLEIRYGGARSHDTLPAIYASSDVFVLPTLSDEWGMVINEAMASGLPVLGSIYSQAVAELVRDGINGWTFVPDRPETVDAAIGLIFAASDEQLLTMGKNARRAVLSAAPELCAEGMFRAVESVFPTS